MSTTDTEAAEAFKAADNYTIGVAAPKLADRLAAIDLAINPPSVVAVDGADLGPLTPVGAYVAAPAPRTLWSGLDRVHNYSDEMDAALDRVRKQIAEFKELKELLHQELDASP